MHTIELDNIVNDKKKVIQLPTVPRIGDWVEIDDEEFCDEMLMTVIHVILRTSSDHITVVIDNEARP